MKRAWSIGSSAGLPPWLPASRRTHRATGRDHAIADERPALADDAVRLDVDLDTPALRCARTMNHTWLS